MPADHTEPAEHTEPSDGPEPSGLSGSSELSGHSRSSELLGRTGTSESSEHTEPSGSSEPRLLPLDPKVRALWWISGALSVIPPTIVALVVDRFAPLPTPDGALTTAVGGIGLLLAAVVPVIRYRRWGYALRDRDLVIRHGVLWVTMTVIPYARLQFVDTRQGPLDRFFGLSQLVVHTASLGVSGRLPGLDAGVAERLRERLAAVETDVVAV